MCPCAACSVILFHMKEAAFIKGVLTIEQSTLKQGQRGRDCKMLTCSEINCNSASLWQATH